MAQMLPPGLAGFVQSQQDADRRNAGMLQQAGTLAQLQEMMAKRQDDEALKAALSQSGGDPEAALNAAAKAGNAGAVQKLLPWVKLANERKQQQETVTGLRNLYAPQPAAAGDATQPAPQPLTAGTNPRQQRIQQLQAQMALYANNPVVTQRYAAEIDRLTNMDTSPKMRKRISGEKEIQEEWDASTNTWKQIGEGPRFARQVAPAGGNDPSGVRDITPDTLRMDAFGYLTDARLPTNMGRGVQGARQGTAIRNEAARIAKEELGMPLEEVRMIAAFNKAGVAAVSQLGRARAQILQLEKVANLNADLALEASNATSRTGVPLLNRGIQWAQQNLAGDEQLRKFTVANETFISEYAKVMSGGYGAAAPTEGAQARAHAILDKSATVGEYQAGVKQLKREMENRVKSLDDQMNDERNRLRTSLGRTPSNAPGVPTPPNPGVAPVAPKVVDFGSLK